MFPLSTATSLSFRVTYTDLLLFSPLRGRNIFVCEEQNPPEGVLHGDKEANGVININLI